MTQNNIFNNNAAFSLSLISIIFGLKQLSLHDPNDCLDYFKSEILYVDYIKMYILCCERDLHIKSSSLKRNVSRFSCDGGGFIRYLAPCT